MQHPENDQITIQVDDAFQSAVDVEDIAACVRATLEHEETAGVSLSVTVTDDETVQALNARYLGINAPTDVLSFGADSDDDGSAEDITFVLPDEIAEAEGVYLGDILIALPYCERQAQRYGNSLASELRLMTVHGTLHLLGHDHDTQESESVMWEAQMAILSELDEGQLAASVGKRDYAT